MNQNTPEQVRDFWENAAAILANLTDQAQHYLPTDEQPGFGQFLDAGFVEQIYNAMLGARANADTAAGAARRITSHTPSGSQQHRPQAQPHQFGTLPTYQ